MKKLFILLVFFPLFTFSQNFLLAAFPNDSLYNISCSFDMVRSKVTINSPFDTIELKNNYSGASDTVYRINSHFLVLSYSIYGGTGLHVSKTVIISIFNNKLINSLDVLSQRDEFESDENFQTVDSSLNRFIINKFDTNNFTIQGSEVMDSITTKRDLFWNDKTLSYYNSSIRLDGSFEILGNKNEKYMYINNKTFDCINILNKSYIKIAQYWYCLYKKMLIRF